MTIPVSSLGLSLQMRALVRNSQAQVAALANEVGTGTHNDVAAALGGRMAEAVSLRGSTDQIEAYQASIAAMQTRTKAMAESLKTVDAAANKLLGELAAASEGGSSTVGTLPQSALSALTSIVGALNVSLEGQSLFAGVDTGQPALQDPTKPAPGRTQSPIDVMKGLIAANPPTDPAGVQALAAAIGKAFASDPSVPADQRFEGGFYRGTPALDASGRPNPRVSGRSDDGTRIEYGLQANDPALRDILQGLTMIAAADLTAMPEDAQAAYIKSAMQTLGTGLDGLRQATARLGGQQADLDAAKSRNESRLTLLNERIVGLEQVDPYTANARLEVLKQQLAASLDLTRQLQGMTLAQLG
ncbi:flagellin [Inquilinus sp. NPDC058860]|uniref:flagellin N-terminal helical domain-containing protein n=1 Tax=Inquilinus sp. NPDC058860 TaxID=3346652 RepID=UPI0036763420